MNEFPNTFHVRPASTVDKGRLKVCYVLSYRARHYIRSKSLIDALASIDAIELHVVANMSPNVKRYKETLSQLKTVAKIHNPDIYIIGFRGHEIYWPSKFIIKNKPVIFDQMMSPSLSLSEENTLGILGKLLALAAKPIEQHILHDCTHVITDTESHQRIFSQIFNLPAEKITPIPIGAIETAHLPIKKHTKFTVLYYGSFLPLHGINQVLSAAQFLGNRSIHFQLIGGNKTAERKIRKHMHKHCMISYEYHQWIPLKELLRTYIPRADLVLGGPFGGTKQAHRIITGKTSQALAQSIPTLIGESDETHLFKHKENCLVARQTDPKSIAEAIAWAYEHRGKLQEIGAAGKRLYDANLSLRIVREQLTLLLFSLNTNASAPKI